MDSIFADSNYFIGLYNSSDSLYQKASQIANKLETEDIRLVISNYVFLEVVTIMSQRLGKKFAIRLGSHLLGSGQVVIIHVDERLHELAWKIFQDIGKKNISFVDCSTLAVMRAEGIKKLLTFDHEDFASLRSRYKFSIL